MTIRIVKWKPSSTMKSVLGAMQPKLRYHLVEIRDLVPEATIGTMFALRSAKLVESVGECNIETFHSHSIKCGNLFWVKK